MRTAQARNPFNIMLALSVLLTGCGSSGSPDDSPAPGVGSPAPSDTTPPSVPVSLQGSIDASGYVVLAWSPSTDQGGAGLVGYYVYRDGVQIANVATESHVDSTVVSGATYAYAVRARDAANNVSPVSSTVSVSMPAAPSGAILNPGPHPRLWVTPERIGNLRAHVSANTVQWQAVKRRADDQLSRGTAFTPDVDEWNLGDLGIACLVTTDARYAQRAEAVLSQYAVVTNTLQRDSGFDYRHLPLSIMAFDWCYAGLSDALRKQVATWLMDRADWVWPDTNSARRGAWGVASAPNNYFWGFMMTGPAALAAHGDDTGVGTVSGANRPQYHAHLTRTKWSSLVVPFFRGWARGGVVAEGTNYEPTRTAALFADAFRTSVSDSAYVSDPFFRAIYQWQLQQVAPNGQHFVYLGEQARDSEGSIIYYERTHHLMLTAFPDVATPTETAISYRMASQWPINRNSTLGLTALDMIYWDTSVIPAADTAALPKWFIDPTTGVVVYRTSHTDPSATLIFFESGPILESHQLFNANGLMVWKGGYWVLGHGQMWDREYDLSQSSTLFTSAGRQTWQEATGGGGRLLAADATESYLYVAGQARDAYGAEANRPLSDFVRKVVYIVDLDALVVVDRVGKSASSSTLTWRWWARPAAGSPNAVGATFLFSNRDGSATLFGENVVGGTATAGATGTGAYFVETTSASSTTTELAVTAMRLGTTPNATVDESNDRVSVRLSNWLVSVATTDVRAESLAVSSDASRFLVADLVPNADYLASDGPSSAQITASAAGVVVFDLSGSGARQVTITRR